MSVSDRATGLTNGENERVPPKIFLLHRFSKELPLRVLMGALLALAAVFVTLAGGYFFAGFVALAAVAATREWHRMVGTASYGREWTVTSIAIATALTASILTSNVALPLTVLAGGALFAAAAGAGKGAPAVWSGLGALYIGVPAWSLVALRIHVPQAQWIVLGVFLTIWTADSGALLVGQAVGGPKLVPSLSPNKTWSGLIGGVILPALAAAGYASVCGGSAARSAMVGLALAVAAHSGDLFESWVKRRVGRKNSGGLIPGHGGVLDRIDSTLFVAPVATALVYVFGAAQLFGVRT